MPNVFKRVGSALIDPAEYEHRPAVSILLHKLNSNFKLDINSSSSLDPTIRFVKPYSYFVFKKASFVISSADLFGSGIGLNEPEQFNMLAELRPEVLFLKVFFHFDDVPALFELARNNENVYFTKSFDAQLYQDVLDYPEKYQDVYDRFAKFAESGKSFTFLSRSEFVDILKSTVGKIKYKYKYKHKND